MLRISTHKNTEFLTFQLEGRLVGPWVATLRDCWKSCLTVNRGQEVQVDLSAVTFVDATGKRLLAEMCRKGAKFIARDCLMKAIVAELDQT
jgi:ABC-type transporter Mla MlaB component